MAKTCSKGIVYKSTGSWYSVKLENGDHLDCKLKGKLRLKGVQSTNPIAVGDWVDIEQEDGQTPLISNIYERKNYIVRKSVNLSKKAHIIACNIDQALLIVTINYPVTHSGFIDRFLVMAEAYHIPVQLIFNKVDLYKEAEMEKLVKLKEVYEKIGYPCHLISTLNDKDILKIKTLLKDKTTLISGNSGVGKSTLINKVESSLNLKTGAISDHHKAGMHTTTFYEMFELSFGGFIIDSPGIKGFGVVDIPKEEIAHCFPEMRDRMHTCKFNNCVHIDEPKCAVKEALINGEIAEFRYLNYLSIYKEDEEENYREKGY